MGIDITSLYTPSASAAGDTSDSKSAQLAIAKSNGYQSMVSGILNGLSAPVDSYDSGISSSLLYQIYDAKAISPTVAQNYQKNLLDSETEAATQQADQIKNQSSTTAATGSANAAAGANSTASEPIVADSASAAYVPQGSGDGYDSTAVDKIYNDINSFYSDPANSYKDFILKSGSSVDTTV